MQLSQEHKLEALRMYAPRVWLAPAFEDQPAEPFLPSSVEFAWRFMKREKRNGKWSLASTEPLADPNSDLGFFKGDPQNAPIYAYWVHKPHVGAIDLVYFTFYPYNRGKFFCGKVWGNHVGDWEHIIVRHAHTD
eukprot:m51a1_g7517 hypothetical protein (134) ;mRNA; r:1587-2077